MQSSEAPGEVPNRQKTFPHPALRATFFRREKVSREQRRQWIHFLVSIATMLLLSLFTVWRAAVTAWRPAADRLYFFPDNGWLGRIDRSWLNDFLLGPGTVACFFVAFTFLYALHGLLGHRANNRSWADHKRLMKIILYGLLVRALLEAWAEEVEIFPSRLVFDPWDLTVELGGIVLGAWIVQTLSYPLFSRLSHFAPEETLPQRSAMRAAFSIDAASVVATGFYIFLTDPFELQPLTLLERQILALEIGIVFVTFRACLKRGIGPSLIPSADPGYRREDLASVSP